ncbi:hypothetical protein WJX84_006322, partial [Apatococcus fuscideae]
ISLVAWESLRPSLLIVGNATIDLVDGKKSLGGAISYAAAVAEAYGVRACIVTAAGSDADLTMFHGHDLYIIPTKSTLTFEHTYTCPQLVAKIARSPAACGYMAQGEQRTLDPTGQYTPPSCPLPIIQVSIAGSFLLPKFLASRLAALSNRFVVTRGELGADDFSSDNTTFHFDAEKVNATDTNGAGDTFATAYMLALSRGSTDPGAVANWDGGQPGCHAAAVLQAGLHHTSAIRDASLWSQLRAASSLRWQWSTSKVAQVVHGIADHIEAVAGPASAMLQHCRSHAALAATRLRQRFGI